MPAPVQAEQVERPEPPAPVVLQAVPAARLVPAVLEAQPVQERPGKIPARFSNSKTVQGGVIAKFRCPFPGKVEMFAFAVVSLFLKLLRNAAAIAEESLYCYPKIILQPLQAGH